jgi:hypothetical protein
LKELRRRYLAKQTWVRPEQIAKTLTGRTHVIGQPNGEPYRPYREHRHYAADGRMLSYREELSAITRASEADGTWSVDGEHLAVTVPSDPTPTKRYILFRNRAGQVAYFNHAPGTQTDRQLAFRTVEVNAAEPTLTPPPTPAEPAPTPQESA